MAERICKECRLPFEPWSGAVSPGSAGARCRPCYNAYASRRPSSKPYTPGGKPRPPVTELTNKQVRNDRRMKQLRAAVIAEEDACGICGESVDKSLPHTHKMSATIDHVTPLALGGPPFTRSNVRLAHRSCNSKAGNSAKAEFERERLALARAALWLADRLAA